MRKVFGLLIVSILLFGVLFSQPVHPIGALEEPGFLYAPGNSMTLQVSAACTVSNPPGTEYQYWREVILARPEMDTITAPLSAESIVFYGAEDGEIFNYYVRAIYEDDTSLWSEPIWIKHDLNDPDYVQYIAAQPCPGADPYVMLAWRRSPFDIGSPIRGYQIYRNPSAGGAFVDLLHITVLTVPLVFDTAFSSSEMYYYEDTTNVVNGETYTYTVVPFDSAGFSVWPGHFPSIGNPRATATLIGPCGGFLPPTAGLKSTPDIIEENQITIELDPGINWFAPYMFYRYRIEDVGTGWEDTTEWTNLPLYTWSPLDECHIYKFYAQARNDETYDTSGWHSTGPTLVDRLLYPGPASDDILTATVNGPGIDIEINIEDHNYLDCGVGIMKYVLYRFPQADAGAFFSVLTEIGPDGLLDWEMPSGTYAPTGSSDVFLYFDDDPVRDPLIDLDDGVTYCYMIIMFDSLFHYTWHSQLYDCAEADKGVVPVMLLPLALYSTGDSVILEIVDTSYGDMVDIQIDWAVDPYFGGGFHSLTLDIHNPVLNNPDDFDTSDWDTMWIVIQGLEEACYWFRAYAFDLHGNMSDSSNVENTCFDNSPPSAIPVDILHSYADSTNTLNIPIWWERSFDAGIGMKEYQIYRSDTPGILGDHIETIDHSPLIYTYEYLDDDPNESNNYHDNYYTVFPVDLFNQACSTGFQRGFEYDTPPFTVSIDTVFGRMIDHEMKIVVQWSDTTPPDFATGGLGNRYRVEHSSSQNLLFIGDPDVISIEPDIYAHEMILPHSIIMGSPNRFFHIATIDLWNNESGYSQIYHFIDTIWFADSMIIHLYTGWNLVSLPVCPGLGCRYYRDIFPMATSCFRYEPPGWVVEDTMQIGYGYYIFSVGDVDVEIMGSHIPEVHHDLPDIGFYTVGGTSDTTDFSITPPEASDSRLYWDNPATGGIEVCYELVPGRGYWILCNTDSAEYDVPALFFKSTNFDIPDWQSQIKIGEQTLYFGTGSDENDLRMPPSPPSRMLPPAFVSEGKHYLSEFTNNNEWILWIPEKIDVTWISDEMPAGLVLETGDNEIDMTMQSSAFLEAGEYKLVLNSLPDKFAVSAHPNPFNASVSIDVTLPESGDVEITILSIDGKIVKNLWSGVKEAGEHSFRWNGMSRNGETVPCGIYFAKTSFGSSQINTRLVFVK